MISGMTKKFKISLFFIYLIVHSDFIWVNVIKNIIAMLLEILCDYTELSGLDMKKSYWFYLTVKIVPFFLVNFCVVWGTLDKFEILKKAKRNSNNDDNKDAVYITGFPWNIV